MSKAELIFLSPKTCSYSFDFLPSMNHPPFTSFSTFCCHPWLLPHKYPHPPNPHWFHFLLLILLDSMSPLPSYGCDSGFSQFSPASWLCSLSSALASPLVHVPLCNQSCLTNKLNLMIHSFIQQIFTESLPRARCWPTGLRYSLYLQRIYRLWLKTAGNVKWMISKVISGINDMKETDRKNFRKGG